MSSLSHIKKFRRSELGAQLLPLGTAVGLPVPYKAGNRFYIFIPLLEKFSSKSDNADERMPLKPPVGEIRLDALNGKLTKFSLYFCEEREFSTDSDEPFCWFPSDTIMKEQWTREKYEEMKESLYHHIDKMVQNGFTDPHKDSFASLFQKMIPEPLLKYYQKKIDLDWLGSSTPPKQEGPLTPFDM